MKTIDYLNSKEERINGRRNVMLLKEWYEKDLINEDDMDIPEMEIISFILNREADAIRLNTALYLKEHGMEILDEKSCELDDSDIAYAILICELEIFEALKQYYESKDEKNLSQ